MPQSRSELKLSKTTYKILLEEQYNVLSSLIPKDHFVWP